MSSRNSNMARIEDVYRESENPVRKPLLVFLFEDLIQYVFKVLI